MRPVEATKAILKGEMDALGLDPSQVNNMVFKGGKDPGGWTNGNALVCVIHEGCGLPNDWNHRDPFAWWDTLGKKISLATGQQVYFEWINSCVAALYPA